MVGPPTSTPMSLSTLDSHWRIEPGNGSVRPFRPKASVYHTSGPSALETRLALMSTKWDAPLNAERGSS